MDFDERLLMELRARPDRRAKKLVSILERPKSNPRRQRVVARLEAGVRQHSELGSGRVDWARANVDWGSIIKLILSFILMFL